jgi:hypothetical protein
MVALQKDTSVDYLATRDLSWLFGNKRLDTVTSQKKKDTSVG